MSLEGELLHAVIVPGTNGVEIGSCSELFKKLWCIVNREEFLDAVVMFTDVVLVLEDSEGSVNLIFVHIVSF